MRFTIDSFGPEFTWSAIRFGPRWNGWATPVVDRQTLVSVVGAAEGESLHFIDDVAVISGEKMRPDSEGNYDLGQLGWCFVDL